MRAKSRADAVYCVVILLKICVKRRVNRLLKSLKTVGYGDNVCTEHLHSYYVGVLLRNIDLAHINVTFHAEIRRRGCYCNAVLTCTRLCDELLFAHVFCKKTLAHTVIELVRTGVVKILTLEVYLAVSEKTRESFTVVNGSGSALKFLSYSAKLVDELRRVANSLVGACRLLKCGHELGRKIRTAKLTEVAALVGKLLKIIVEILVLIHIYISFVYPIKKPSNRKKPMLGANNKIIRGATRIRRKCALTRTNIRIADNGACRRSLLAKTLSVRPRKSIHSASRAALTPPSALCNVK